MERKAGTICLARLAAVDSIDRNLRTEDEEIRQCGQEFQEHKSPTVAEGDPMRIMAAGDVTVHQQPAETPNQAAREQSLLSKAAPLVLAGILGATGIGIPAAGALAWALGAFDNKPATEAIDTDTRYMLRLLPGE